jgi:hypothetical protein
MRNVYKELKRREGDKRKKDVKVGKIGVRDVDTIFNDRRNCACANFEPSDEIPRDVTSCNLVERYKLFGGICFFSPETGRSRFTRNLSSYLPKYTTQHFVIRCSLKKW